MALGHANMILSWEENLATEEMPPRWMWHLPWEINRHMEKVVADRKAKYESKPNSEGSDDASSTWEADDDDVQAWIRQNTGGA